MSRTRFSVDSFDAPPVEQPDAWQGSLFDAAPAGPTLTTLAPERTHLTHGAWMDLQPGWMLGSDEVFAALVRDVPWEAERREMYDRVVDTPRLLRFYGERDTLPHPALSDVQHELNRHYRDELGEEFVTAGLCYYRDGHDSVAWHGDDLGRGSREDTMVAIVSFGEARRLSLRPRGGGSSMAVPLGHGDLVVMGGSCQRTWEHAILKTARHAGPRISVQFRPRGVR